MTMGWVAGLYHLYIFTKGRVAGQGYTAEAWAALGAHNETVTALRRWANEEAPAKEAVKLFGVVEAQALEAQCPADGCDGGWELDRQLVPKEWLPEGCAVDVIDSSQLLGSMDQS